MWVKLQHVNTVTAKGRTYHYHRKTGERLPDNEAERAARVVAINAGLEKEREIAHGTMAALVEAYKASSDYRKRAAKTRKDYMRYLDYYAENFGDLPVSEIDREFVLELRDKFQDTPRTADYMIAILRRILNFAVDRHKTFGLKLNPALRPGRLHETEGYQPWPDALIAAFRQKAYPELRWLMEMGLYTGQRGEDCVPMLWSHYEAGMIAVAQQKGGARLMITAHRDLRTVLGEMPRRAAVILTTRTGRPWKLDHMRHEINETVAACGFPGYSFHGLRKNAARNMAEAGCSEKEIASVTGHKTLAMVQLYTKEAEQQRLAKSAVRKLERKGKRVLQNRLTDSAKLPEGSAK